jgi:hypothetical protein
MCHPVISDGLTTLIAETSMCNVIELSLYDFSDYHHNSIIVIMTITSHKPNNNRPH